MDEQIKQTPQELLRACVAPLLEWHSLSRRALPWRDAPTPYQVWVSEIMLQQTRIEAVIPYYERFMSELPTVEVLAAVPEERLLKLWEGLGYYSRARNLHKAAKELVKSYGGQLPRRAVELRTLPGIGAYTAGAIASIAYGEPEPAVDGNVLRVVMRLTACDDDVLAPDVRERVAAQLREIYPRGREAGLLTEGLMELGETLCIPNGEARCALCPLRERCRAFARGETERYPVRAPKKERRREERAVLLLRCGALWAVRRREDKGLLAGMWEFPGLEGQPDEAKIQEYLRALGAAPLSAAPCGRAKHIFTHVEWHMTGWLVDCAAPAGEGLIWLTADEIAQRCAIPTAFRKFWKFIAPSSKN